jgi:hypothetical protein
VKLAAVHALLLLGLVVAGAGCSTVPQAKLPRLHLNEFMPAMAGDERLRSMASLRELVEWLNARRGAWVVGPQLNFTRSYYVRFYDATTGLEITVADGYRHGALHEHPVGVMIWRPEGVVCYNLALSQDEALELAGLLGSLR